MKNLPPLSIKAIIGLGNPGRKYQFTRHNIGFLVVDALCEQYGGTWQSRDVMEIAEISINMQRVVLVKPQTFMNDSGKVIPLLQKQGVQAENILVVHDELEMPFGKMKIKVGGSARGHNGLRSIIERCGKEFARLCFGIGRPEQREMVGQYVLQNFSEDMVEVQRLIDEAAEMAGSLMGENFTP